MNKIKPCPFCNSRAVHLYEGFLDVRYVVCLECGAKGPAKDNADEAAKLWNERATGWISVEDRMPELGKTVLICWADNHEIEAEKDFLDVCANYGNEYWVNFSENEPTHWIPLPEPPTK